MLLFVDSCMRKQEKSRTYQLCDAFLNAYQKGHPGETIRRVRLAEEHFMPFTADSIEKRDALLAEKKLEDKVFLHANQFAKAERIVVGAPYWDMSFPAALKAYIEHICVCGITFCYTQNGMQGLCRAEKLLYITTAGGIIGAGDYGTDYIRGLFQMLGIPNFQAVKAEGLDIEGANCKAILSSRKEALRRLAEGF